MRLRVSSSIAVHLAIGEPVPGGRDRQAQTDPGGRLSPAQDLGAHHFMKTVAERLRPT